MTNQTLKAKFNKAILDAVEESKTLGYNPTRFIQMFYETNQDGVELVKSLVLGKTKVTTGLENLWEIGRLDLTLEAKVIRPEFQELFESEIIETCTKRLKKFGYKL